MARVEINAITSHFNGRLGDIRFRDYLGCKVVALRRKPSKTPPTEAQQKVQERFLLAVTYAKGAVNDPATRAFYAAQAQLRQMPLFALIMGDYLNPPVVGELDLSAYHGRIGDPVKVLASDDTEVVSVDVVIRDAADAVIEQGPAALVGGQWTYTATVAVAPGETVTIEAVAKDHPGHTGSKTVPCVIG